MMCCENVCLVPQIVIEVYHKLVVKVGRQNAFLDLYPLKNMIILI